MGSQSGRFQANRRCTPALRDPKGGLSQIIRDEIRTQVAGGKHALGLAAVAGPDQDGSRHARIPGAFDVFDTVADHHGGGKVDPVFAPGRGEQAGPGLAAWAVLGGQVGADQNVADEAAVRLHRRTHAVVDLGEGLRGEKPAVQAGLVGDDDGAETAPRA
jgi:hypothetical protein